MNGLSILIYLADMIGSLDAGLIFLSTLTTVIFFFAMGLWIITHIAINASDWQSTIDGWKRFRPTAGKTWRYATAAMLVAGFLSAVVPSQKTVYLIAASEVAGYAINTPEGEKIRTIVNQELQDIIDEEMRRQPEEE